MQKAIPRFRLFAAVCVGFLTALFSYTGYLLISRSSAGYSPIVADVIALLAAAGTGSYIVFRGNASESKRVVACSLFLPCVAVFLYFYSLFFLASTFHEGL